MCETIRGEAVSFIDAYIVISGGLVRGNNTTTGNIRV